MNTAPEARIAHHTRGRVRLVIPSKKRDREYFAATETELRNIPSVKSILTNPLTGTLLLHYEGKWVPFREGLSALTSFKVSMKKHRKKGEAIPRAFVEVRKLNEKVERVTDYELNLASLVGLGMLGLSALQVYRRHFLPPASTLLSEGLRILAELNRIKTRKDSPSGGESEAWSEALGM